MQPGTLINGKYRIESMLGRGGMGSVYRAEHLGLKAPVAVKLMDPAIAANPESLARFRREAHAAAQIRSAHVVQVLDHGVDESLQQAFIVMEMLEGETLAERLERRGALSVEGTLSVIGDVCYALTRAHQAGIVHRDLKPENIFLVNDERALAKVLDFGVAKSQPLTTSANGTTRTGSLIGTPSYMSPEQISGAADLDGRSDLWSVGVIACECITGRRPFEQESIGALALAICTRPVPTASSLGPATPAFDAWLARALERDPSQRFQTARELAEALTAACSEPGLRGTPATALQPFSTPSVRAHAQSGLASDSHARTIDADTLRTPLSFGAAPAPQLAPGAPAVDAPSAAPSASSTSPPVLPNASAAVVPEQRSRALTWGLGGALLLLGTGTVFFAGQRPAAGGGVAASSLPAAAAPSAALIAASPQAQAAARVAEPAALAPQPPPLEAPAAASGAAAASPLPLPAGAAPPPSAARPRPRSGSRKSGPAAAKRGAQAPAAPRPRPAVTLEDALEGDRGGLGSGSRR